MVVRKSSQSASSPPYPISPKSAQDNTFDSPQSHLDVDSSDIPPPPSFTQRSPSSTLWFPQTEIGNPWTNETSHAPDQDKALPQILQAGHRGEDTNQVWSSPNIPQAPQSGAVRKVTPRSSFDSQRSKDFWDDDEEEEEEGYTKLAPPVKPPKSASLQTFSEKAGRPEGSSVPSPGGLKRKPLPQPQQPSEQNPQDHFATPSPAFLSNNPFRKSPYQIDGGGEGTSADLPQWGSGVSEAPAGKGKEVVRPRNDNFDLSSKFGVQPDLLSSSPPRISYHDQSYPPRPEQSAVFPLHPDAPPPPPPQVHLNATSPVPQQNSPYSAQTPLISVNSETVAQIPWSSEQQPFSYHQGKDTIPEYVSAANPILDHGQETEGISRADGSSTLPSTQNRPASWRQGGLADDSGIQNSHQPEVSLIDDDVGPPLPVRPERQERTNSSDNYYESPEGPPPPKPPRPSVVTTDAQLAQMMEQRNETYQIKHFNWFDHHTGRLRRSSMLTQNKNGPCPLLALVNALILGARDDSQAALDNALRAREQVSLGLIIETLMDELMSGEYTDTLPDVDELNRFLTMLHTGMNANPKFVNLQQQPANLMDAPNSTLHFPHSLSERKFGEFEETQDIRLYGSFSIPLVHGWLPPRSDPARAAFARSAPTYEDAQVLQFGEEELDHKMSHGGLTTEEQRLWEDIVAIKTFFKTYPTQLTPYGLELIGETLYPGSFAILFRNDHFNTLYKHPESGQLFTLVTDAGYSDRDEIIWESLVDVSGKNSEFFSGDFRSVGNNVDPSQSASIKTSAGPPPSFSAAPSTGTPSSSQKIQEQHDADFAMALQLQEEEEQANRRRRGNSNRPSEGNIPIRLRPPQPEARPLIPPRTSRSQNIAVNRPVDANVEDAPPAYEEAAKGRPYIPPVGSPHHPETDPSPRSSTVQLTPTTSSNAVPSGSSRPPPPFSQPRSSSRSGQGGPARLQRRTSAYSENNQHFVGSSLSGLNRQRSAAAVNSDPVYGSSYGGQRVGGGGGGGGRGRQGKREDKDCVVM